MAVWQPGGVPVPEPETSRVFDLANPQARAFLTGNLPAPVVRGDGVGVCDLCGRRLPLARVVTHVPGSAVVRRMIVPHPCRPKVAA